MVNQGVAADDGAHLLDAAVVGDQLGAGGHIDAVDIGIAHRRRGAGEVDLARAGVAGHLDNLLAGGAAHDGVVDQQHIAALELAGDGIELLAHRLFAHRLSGHDESAAHVAVFHKTFAVRQAQQLRQLCGARPAGLGNRNDHVNFAGRHGGDHTLGQGLAQIEPRLVHRNAIHDRIRACQVHKLENTGVEHGRLGALLRLHLALQVNKNRLAGSQVPLELVQRAFQGHRFTGQHDLVRAAPDTQRPDAKRIAKSQHPVPGNQRNHRIRALDAQMHLAHRFKQMRWLQGHASGGTFYFMGQHIEKHLGVALGVDVAVVHGKELVLERVRIGQVAVVHQHDAKRGVDVKGLGLFFAKSIARRRIAHLSQPALARQRAHIAGAKHVLDHALGFVHEKFIVLLRHDACGILPPVLQQQQGIVNELVHRCVADNADNSTHLGFTRSRDKSGKSLGQQGFEAGQRRLRHARGLGILPQVRFCQGRHGHRHGGSHQDQRATRCAKHGPQHAVYRPQTNDFNNFFQQKNQHKTGQQTSDKAHDKGCGIAHRLAGALHGQGGGPLGGDELRRHCHDSAGNPLEIGHARLYVRASKAARKGSGT